MLSFLPRCLLTVVFFALAGSRTNAAAPTVPTAGAAFREYREYPSTSDPALRLFARFGCATSSGVLLVKMHGWHGQVKTPHSDNIPSKADQGYFVIEPEMRGRGDATGNPDCNGWELQDVVDAVTFARTHYRDRIVSPAVVLLSGGSGGGGNTYALVGKFPDLFAAAVSASGISDYAMWHTFDRKGEVRDELEGSWDKNPRHMKPWIGGTPETNAEAYHSRGGLTTVGNLLTPTLAIHGAEDIRVPALHARLWIGAAHGQGLGALVTYLEFAGVGDHRGHYANETPEQQKQRVRAEAEFLQTHRTPPALPRRGSFVVAGYVKTAEFEVILDSIDRVGRVDFDLDAGKFDVRSATAKQALVRIRHGDAWRQSDVACRP
jgi:hypothetical protein